MAIPPRSPFSTASCLSVFLVAKLTCQFEVRWGETDLWVLPVSCLFSEFYSSMVLFYSRCLNTCWITVLANISSSRSLPLKLSKDKKTQLTNANISQHHLASLKKTSQLFPPFHHKAKHLHVSMSGRHHFFPHVVEIRKARYLLNAPGRGEGFVRLRCANKSVSSKWL